jgi:hypothetical protein
MRTYETKVVPVELKQLVPLHSGQERNVKQKLMDNTDVFALGSKSLRRTNMVRPKNNTEGAGPIKQAPRRIP